MNKKIAAIIAGSVAALGSAIVAAPAHAQTAPLDVQITVKPAVFLRTYKDLKFVVSQQDFKGTGSVEQAISYDETTGAPAPLSVLSPDATGKDTVEKEIKQLYQVWGGSTNTKVTVEASEPTLKTSTSGTIGNSADTVMMTVAEGAAPPSVVAPAGSPYYTGSAKLSFKFSNPATAAGTVYNGGRLTISVTNP